jgi:hypothetical protein
MSRKSSPAIAREPLALVVGGLCGLFAIAFFVVAFLRARHPFELEWMEGGVLAHVQRVRDGQPIYTAPTLQFVPFIYTPLYYHVAALVSRVVGPGFFALRLTSILATIGCATLLHLHVKRETGGAWLPSIVAPGLFFAGYRRGAEFFDLGRVDALFMFFLLAALTTIRFGRARGHQVLAGALLTFAFFTKQSALIVALAMLAHVVTLERLRAWPIVVTTVSGIVLGALLVDARSDGWFRYYTLEIPQSHAIEQTMWTDYWSTDLAPWAIAIAALLFVLVTRPQTLDRPAHRFYFFGTFGMLGTAWSSRLHTGGFHNVLLPAIAWLSLVAGVGLHAAQVAIDELSVERRAALQRFVLAAVAAQLVVHLYDPRQVLPRRRDREAGFELVETLKRYPGDVYVPAHPYLAVMAGKASFAHEMAMNDVLRVDDEPSNELRIGLVGAIRSRRFGAFVEGTNDWFGAEVVRHYDAVRDAVLEPEAFYCVSGIRVRPERIWVPHHAPAP